MIACWSDRYSGNSGCRYSGNSGIASYGIANDSLLRYDDADINSVFNLNESHPGTYSYTLRLCHSQNGATCLMYASKAGFLDVVNKTVTAKADLNAKTTNVSSVSTPPCRHDIITHM